MKKIAMAVGLMSVFLCGPQNAVAFPIEAAPGTLAHAGAPVIQVFFRGGGRRFAGRRFGWRGRRYGYGYGRRRFGVAAGLVGAAIVGGAVAAGAASGCRRFYNPNTGAYVTNC